MPRSSAKERANVRVLGIESSSPRGSIALLENGDCVVRLEHRTPQAHAESLLPLVEQALKQARWQRASIERIAVGVGPGSFTGLRVGIALAQGMALGLGVDAVGVGSLEVMAAGVPQSDTRARCSVLDARRGEAFVAAYGRDGEELMAPRTVAADAVARQVRERLGQEPLFIGAHARALSLLPHLAGPDTDLPDAKYTALLASLASPPHRPPLPQYVRDADAKLPELPVSPLRGSSRPNS